MAVKHKNLYLYLTLVCFLGIILIFIFDGYMGVYDNLVIDNGQYKQTVTTDQWAQQERFGLISTGMDRNGRLDFTYTVENHRFSRYSESLEVYVLYNREKIADLSNGLLSIAPFSKSEGGWAFNAADIVPADYPVDQNFNVNVVIKRGDITREIFVSVNPGRLLEIKPPPAR